MQCVSSSDVMKEKWKEQKSKEQNVGKGNRQMTGVIDKVVDMAKENMYKGKKKRLKNHKCKVCALCVKCKTLDA